ncbi:MAG: hypothetical protein SFY80_02850 [Verrucomicrobiota bacterium]|nr:hypothetical protein [Verrucomicrobiota bacterium]
MIANRFCTVCRSIAPLAILPCTLFAGWEISTGPVYRWDMEISMTGPSHAQVELFQAAVPYQKDPTGIGSLALTGDRTYDDGFVNRDAGTDNPEAIGGPGMTWNWGISNASVYDKSSATLRYHKSGGEKLSLLSTSSVEGQQSIDSHAAGWELAARYVPEQRESWSVAWMVAARYHEKNGQLFSGSNYSQQWLLESYQLADTFPLQGVVPSTSPLYSGTYNGPGPVIANRPSTRTATNFQTLQTWTAANQWQAEIDTSLWELRAGPEFRTALDSRISAVLNPAISLNRMVLEGTQMEQFSYDPVGVLRTWHDSSSAEKWSFGASVDAGLEFYAEPWSATVLAGYHWVSDSVESHLGPSRVLWEPSGFTFNVSIGYRY